MRAIAVNPLIPAGVAALLWLGAAQAGDTFTNPLLPSGPDPWVVRDGPNFYYMHTLGDRLAIWKTRDIADLAHAERRTIWTPPASGPNAQSIWAPELHRIDGKWYVYYTAAASGHDDDDHRGIFVLETVSVVTQVFSYKVFGKRVFLMAPIHHHFEKKGWAEPKIIVRFWIISILLALIGLSSLKVR